MLCEEIKRDMFSLDVGPIVKVDIWIKTLLHILQLFEVPTLSIQPDGAWEVLQKGMVKTTQKYVSQTCANIFKNTFFNRAVT